MKTQILSKETFKALTVFQFNFEPKDEMKIITGDEAIESKQVIITETSDSGTVGNLLAQNLSNEFVFFSDGDILKGAKQNRTLNTSILMRPNSKVIFPVSCVEEGRWRFNSRNFKNEKFSKPPKLRKEMNENVLFNKKKNPKSFDANQSKVWESVSLYNKIYEANSDTLSYSDVYDKEIHNFDNFKNKFSYSKNSSGFAFFKNNKLISIDAFNNTHLGSHYFNKLLLGIIPDVYLTQNIENYDEKKCLDVFDYFISAYGEEKFIEHKGVDVGVEKRFDSEILTGLELTYETRLIHLSIINLN